MYSNEISEEDIENIGYNLSEEFENFHKILNDFEELVRRYGIDYVLANMDDGIAAKLVVR